MAVNFRPTGAMPANGLTTLADLFPTLADATPLGSLVSDLGTRTWFDFAGFTIWSDISCMALDEIREWPGLGHARVDQLIEDFAQAASASVEEVPAARPSLGAPASHDPSTREQLMIQMRAEGATLAAIGGEFGVSPERARQIIARHGGPTPADVRAKQAQRRQEQAEAKRRAIDEVVRPVLMTSGAISIRELSEATGIADATLAEFWPEDLEYLRIRAAGRSEQTWNDADIFNAIQAAALYEFPLTAKAYSELVRIGQVHGPSLARVHQRFGGWAVACDAAGVEHGQTPRPSYNSRWTDEELIAFARDYFLDPAWPSSAHRFDEWRIKNAIEAPSFQTLRNRFGSWSSLKRLALTPGDRA